ncbi:MAG: STT3 domain-containing protein [Candidatus Bathyarchaeia archaeon]
MAKFIKGIGKALGRLVPKGRFGDALRSAIGSMRAIPRSDALTAIALALIVASAAALRLLPLRWGAYLSEFDPYLQYRIADHLVKNGYSSFFSWHDSMSWYPWGRDIFSTSYPGLSFSAAVLYRFLLSLGIDPGLYRTVVFFPVVMGALSALAIYFLGKELWGRPAGLISALFLAFNSAYISRTSLGFFDDESVGIFAAIIMFTFFLRSISPERSPRSAVIYSLMAGLSMSFLCASWGALARYAPVFLALFSVALALLGRHSPRLLFSYSLMMAFGIGTACQLPRLGYGFLTEWTTLSIPAAFAIILMACLFSRAKGGRDRALIALGFLAALAIAYAALWATGRVQGLEAKFWTVLQPMTRAQMPLIESVAEHRPATWASLYYEFGVLCFLGIFGFAVAVRRLRNSDIFLLIYGLTTLYFASSFIRLSLLLAPALSLAGGMALMEIAKPSVDVIKEAVVYPAKRIRHMPRVGREFGAAALLILLLASVPTFHSAARAAYSPATIVTSSIPASPPPGEPDKYSDWLEACLWMRDALPKDAVVFSWWDYGYWITAIGERYSLADNGTINATQIAMIALAFLSNETRALPILKYYNVSHVAVFATYTRGTGLEPNFLGFGEDSKWYWMARIGNGSSWGGERTYFVEKRAEGGSSYFRLVYEGDRLVSNETFVEKNRLNVKSMLGLLINRGAMMLPAGPYFEMAFSSKNNFVFIYKVNYPSPYSVSCTLSQATITYGEGIEISGQLNSTKPDAPIGGIPVSIEISEDGGLNWRELARVESGANGTYSHSWRPEGGAYSIRVRWRSGDPRIPDALSTSVDAEVKRANSQIDLFASANSTSVGQAIGLKALLGVNASDGLVVIEYRLGNETWSPILYGLPRDGDFTASWKPTAPGTYLLRARWSGNRNYLSSISPTIVLTVKPD